LFGAQWHANDLALASSDQQPMFLDCTYSLVPICLQLPIQCHLGLGLHHCITLGLVVCYDASDPISLLLELFTVVLTLYIFHALNHL